MRPFAILGLFILLFASCNLVEEPNEVDKGDYVELTFKITTSINSRGNVSENPYDTQNWTQAEKAVDGRIICNLSAYLYDKTTKAIYKATDDCISISPQANSATVTFDQRLNLNPGDYTLMVVANNSDPKISDITCGVTSWKDSSYDELMNNIISIPSDNVSPKNTVQPLSLMKDVTLDKGNNYITGELKRTFSRVRITIKNNSTELPLKVKEFNFSNNFTQTQAYVFDDDSDRKYFGSLGAPLTTSQHALQPFTPNSNDGSLSIDCQSSSVVFDGYILESQLSGNNVYQYTPNLLYDGVVVDPEEPEEPEEPEGPKYIVNWDSPITNSNLITEGLYLISYKSADYYATIDEATNNLISTQLSKSETYVDPKYVWNFTPTSDGYFYIQNAHSEAYIQKPVNGVVMTQGPEKVAFDKLGTSSVILKLPDVRLCMSFYLDYYSQQYLVRGYNNTSNSASYLRLYPVSIVTNSRANTKAVQSSTISFNEPITLKIIDPNTNQASDTKEIKRNAFIDIYVTVNYNTSTGEISYIVNDWNQGGGDILFD